MDDGYSGGHRTRLPLGKGRRRTSKKFCAFLEVRVCLALLYLLGKRTSKKFFRNLSLVWPHPVIALITPLSDLNRSDFEITNR